MESSSITSKANNFEHRDRMDNEVSSVSSDDGITHQHKVLNTFKTIYADSTVSDNEVLDMPKHKSGTTLKSRTHYKSMGNINDNNFKANDLNRNRNRLHDSVNSIDLNLHRDQIKKFESLQIPIVGYEVMEERARFTIYKLKVEDDKRDQSWLVFRRYTDFVRLYSRLKSEQPSLLLPLPGKRWFRDNFEPAFLEERVRGLQIFVNAVLENLRSHHIVREFFCLDEPPQVLSYQPEVQAVYGALEDSITTLKMQLRQKDATIMHLQTRMAQLEAKLKKCPNCSTNVNINSG